MASLRDEGCGIKRNYIPFSASIAIILPTVALRALTVTVNILSRTSCMQ